MKKLPVDEKYDLSRQMKRAAISLTNNIAEGFGRYHFQENLQFCRQSRGSLFELMDDLNICIDESYITREDFERYRKDALHLLKVLNGYIYSTKKLQREWTSG